jgi:hypothetical protein
MRCLQDLDQIRLQHMDEAGIDRQVIAITAPGVQVMDKATAVAISRSANDQLAEAVRRHPTRFTGMIAIAPQDPASAAKEIEARRHAIGHALPSSSIRTRRANTCPTPSSGTSLLPLKRMACRSTCTPTRCRAT